MKYAILDVSLDRKRNTNIYSWVCLGITNSLDEKIIIVKREISYLEDEIMSLNNVNKILSRRRKELKQFKDLLKLLEENKAK